MTNNISIKNPIPSIDWVNNSNLISRFPGAQTHPITGKYVGHAGLDIKTPIGTQIISPADGGVVSKIGWDTKFIDGKKVGYGRYVDVDYKLTSPDGSKSTVTLRFAHLEKNGVQVKIGDALKNGQNIATTGNSGGSTGPHLHYEVIVDGKRIDARSITNIDELQNSSSQFTPIDINSENPLLTLINYNKDNEANQSTVDQGNQNPTNESENIPQEEVPVDEVKDMLATEDMKQTANFMSEVKLQLPSMMGVMVARLALGEDIELVSADMASRLIATSAINAYAENNWSSSGGRDSVQASSFVS